MKTIAQLMKKRESLRKHTRTCHREASGAFCGFCDAAYEEIDEINAEIKRLKREQKKKG
jgi:hypothetical protein